MRKSLIILTLAATGLYSCGQRGESASVKVSDDLATADSIKEAQRLEQLIQYPSNYFDTEFNYADIAKKGLIIQNSFPKGGMPINGLAGYTDSTGKNFGYALFWTRIINETTTPLALTLNFPADSFVIPAKPDSYFKLLLLPDPMTVDKQSSFNYGYDKTRLISFLDKNFHKPTTLQRTIKPQEECLFYVSMFTHNPYNGTIRAGFSLKEQNLVYTMNISSAGSKEIPSGRLSVER